MKIVGEIARLWIANKFLDAFWDKIKSVVYKSKERTKIIPLIEIESDRNLIINLNLNNSAKINEALKKLPKHINDPKKRINPLQEIVAV